MILTPMGCQSPRGRASDKFYSASQCGDIDTEQNILNTNCSVPKAPLSELNRNRDAPVLETPNAPLTKVA